MTRSQVQSQYLQALREEAALYRRDGKEQAAIQLERMATRIEKMMRSLAK